MKRLAFAFIFSPLLVSMFFGWPAMLLVAPFALLVTAVVAAPLFIIFRKLGWLHWWQVAFAGFACGLLFTVAVDSPARLDMFGIRDLLLFGGAGILIALIFWWFGIFRNSAIQAVSSSLPFSMFALIPIAALAVQIHQTLDTSAAEGRIIAVEGAAPSRELTVRLSNGDIVNVSFLQDSRPTETLIDQCWHFTNHWSTWRFRRVYSPSSPFGGSVNDC